MKTLLPGIACAALAGGCVAEAAAPSRNAQQPSADQEAAEGSWEQVCNYAGGADEAPDQGKGWEKIVLSDGKICYVRVVMPPAAPVSARR